MPDPLGQDFCGLEVALVIHLLALCDPVAKVHKRQAKPVALRDLPEDAVGAIGGAGLIG